jgi:type VI secretion system secreted protein VgrG
MPIIHRLRFVMDAKIFQTQSVPQIVAAVLKANGVTQYMFDLRETHAARDYVVQYRETSFDFITRLLTEESTATTRTATS